MDFRIISLLVLALVVAIGFIKKSISASFPSEPRSSWAWPEAYR